jgi:hypothetical protein
MTYRDFVEKMSAEERNRPWHMLLNVVVHVEPGVFAVGI